MMQLNLLHLRAVALSVFVGILINTPATGQPGPAIEWSVPQAISTGTSNPYAPFLADLDGDGDIDLAHNHYEDNFLNIYLNDGSGVFGAPTLITLALDGGRGGRNLHGGDLDGDGDIDLVTGISQATNNGHVLVFLNNGDATFAAPQTILSTDRPRTIVVEDMNGDTYEDVVVITDNTANIRVLLNDGAGNFAEDQVLGGPFGMSHFVVGDFDGDSRSDIAAYSSNNKQIAIYLTQGTPGLVQVAIYATGGSNGDIVAIDLEKDGDLDLLAGAVGPNVILALDNDGSGTFSVSTLLSPGEASGVQPLADFNGDGNLDLPIVSFAGNREVTVYAGDGSGQFGNPVTLADSGPVRYAAVADLNGDGLPDLVVPSFATSGAVKILLNETAVGRSDFLVYYKDVAGNLDVYRSGRDGSGEIRLTTDAAADWDPVPSFDGSQVVFRSRRSGLRSDLWLMNADGSSLRQLTSSASAMDALPRWSVAGDKIAFRGFRPWGAGGSVWVINADGTDERKLYEAAGFDASPVGFSADGRRVFFTRNPRNTRDHTLMSMSIDGSDVQIIAALPSQLLEGFASADGTVAVFQEASGANIFRINTDGSGFVGFNLGLGNARVGHPQVSRLNRVIFGVFDEDSQLTQVWTTNLNGGDRQILQTGLASVGGFGLSAIAEPVAQPPLHHFVRAIVGSSRLVSPAAIVVNRRVRFEVFTYTQADSSDSTLVEDYEWDIPSGLGVPTELGQMRVATIAGVREAIQFLRRGDSFGFEIVTSPSTIDGLIIEPSEIILLPGDKVDFSAVGVDRFGNRFPLVGVNVGWHAVPEGSGEIQDRTGIFTADRVGTVYIVAVVDRLLRFGDLDASIHGTGKVSVASAQPLAYALHANAPNPFNPETTIGFSLPQAGRVNLVVYDALGQRVRELVSAPRSAGVHQVRWDGRDGAGAQVSSGVYFYRLHAGDFVQTKRMMLIK